MFWKWKKEKRKERVDEKIHVQPTISVAFKEQIERLAFILDLPVKTVGEKLFIWGIDEREVIERYAPFFRSRNFIYYNTVFIGNENNEQMTVTIGQPSERISLRFDEDGHHDVELFADLLQLEKSKTVAIIMYSAIRHPAIIEGMLRYCNRRMHFDEVVIDEMKKLMKFVNHKNPYKTVWNEKFLQFLEGPQQRPRRMIRPITAECIDTETYKWSFD